MLIACVMTCPIGLCEHGNFVVTIRNGYNDIKSRIMCASGHADQFKYEFTAHISILSTCFFYLRYKFYFIYLCLYWSEYMNFV